MLKSKPAIDKITYTWLIQFAKFLPFVLLVFITQWPFRHVPFFYDSLGYVLVIADFMRHQNTILPPAWCDPGHPPLAFLTLALNWEILGDSILVSHITQWLWSALLLAGFYRLMIKAFQFSKLWAAGTVLLLWVHPFTFALAMQLVPDVAMVALFIWTLGFYYERRKISYAISFALTLLSKANAAPLLLIFCVVEFLIIPLGKLWHADERHHQLQEKLVWINYTALGTIPYIAWLIIHKVYTGFWFANRQFQTSFVFDWSFSNLFEQFRTTILWGLWWREGHRIFVSVILFLFFAGMFVRYFRKVPLRDKIPSSVGSHAISFAIQATIICVLYSAKELRLFRFFYPAVVLGMPVIVILFYQSYRILSSHCKGKLMHVLCTVLFVLLTANFVIRWHPFIINKAMGESKYFAFLRNSATIGYDMNLEIIPALHANRLAAQYLQELKNEAPNQPRIVTSYPFTQALNYPVAGFVDQPIPNEPFDKIDDYFSRDWDYFVFLPEFHHLHPLVSDPRFLEAADVDRRFKGEWDSWNYEVIVYKRKN